MKNNKNNKSIIKSQKKTKTNNKGSRSDKGRRLDRSGLILYTMTM